MKIVLAGLVVALVGCSTTTQTGESSNAQRGAAEQSAGRQDTATGHELSDLATMTFGCPTAALNAAAREAAKVKSQGTYQFAFFNIINDAHHATYEVRFKSNYHAEEDLKYCVAIYCQQGWDPKNTQVTVARIDAPGQHAGVLASGADCAGVHVGAKRKN
jgi:hypothetical protein